MRGTFLELGTLLGLARVGPDADGVLTVRNDALGPKRLVPLGPDLFRERDGEVTVAFLRDESGEIRHFAADQFAFDRTGFFDDPIHHVIAVVGCTLLFVGTLVGWVLGFGARRLAGAAPSPVAAVARAVGAAAAILWTVAVIGVAHNLSATNLFELLYESLPGSFVLLLWVPVVAAVPTLALPWVARRGVEGNAPLARLHLWALAAAAWLMLAIAWSWHLLGP
jgi:hypothetical protein